MWVYIMSLMASWNKLATKNYLGTEVLKVSVKQ